jgi:hypothetical protein
MTAAESFGRDYCNRQSRVGDLADGLACVQQRPAMQETGGLDRARIHEDARTGTGPYSNRFPLKTFRKCRRRSIARQYG